MYEFDVVILEDETGGYVALVPALPGCHTQGDTLEELMENIKEAIELHGNSQQRRKGRPSAAKSGRNTKSEGTCLKSPSKTQQTN